jgi:hypothetical protein
MFHDAVPRLIEAYNIRRLHSALGISAPLSSRTPTPAPLSKQTRDPVQPEGRTPIGGQYSVPIDSSIRAS